MKLCGINSTDRPIFSYRFGVDLLGAVDAQGGEPLPVVSGGCTINDVMAIVRAQEQYRFSDDETSWHDTRLSSDIYYQTRYPDGDWSESILIINGTDGTDGQPGAAATIQVGSVTSGLTASVTNVGTPSAAIFDFVIPVGGGGGGQIYTAGSGIDISAGGVISFNTDALSGTATSAALQAHIDDASVHVPSGGTAGQVLTKTENGFGWAAGGGGGATYTAGNGITISDQNVISVASDLLNGYATISYVDSAVSGKATTSALTAHTSDSTIHVTSADKTNWNAKLDSTALQGYATTQYVDAAISGVQPSPYKAVVESYTGSCVLSPTGQFYLIGYGTSLTSGTIDISVQVAEYPASGYASVTEGLIAIPESGGIRGNSPVYIQSGFVPGYINAFKATWMRGYNDTIFGCLLQPMGVIDKFGLNIKWPNWEWDFPYINNTPAEEYDLTVSACTAYPDANGGYVISGYDQTSEKPIYVQPDGIYSISYGMGMMQWTLDENGAQTYLQTETMADSPVTGPWIDVRTQQSGAMVVTLSGDEGGGGGGGGGSATTSYTVTSMEAYFNGTYNLSSGTAGTKTAVYQQEGGAYYIAYNNSYGWTMYGPVDAQTNSGPTGDTPAGTLSYMDSGQALMTISVVAAN